MKTDVVVVGSGYAGVLTADWLTQRDGVAVTLVGPKPGSHMRPVKDAKRQERLRAEQGLGLAKPTGPARAGGRSVQ